MSLEERELMGDAWDPIRVQYATLAGMRSYENKDFAAIERIINAATGPTGDCCAKYR
jgi:hypothetical protein